MERWCGEHKPCQSDVCSKHSFRWYEFHDEELLDDYALAAVFYCRESFCDNFSYAVNKAKSGCSSPTEYFLSRHNKVWPITLEEDINEVFAGNIFAIRVRQKILFHKLGGCAGDGK